ncbi:ferrochelatase [Methylocapsa aurea]|uniref:ferrochelatase n=1 Tax=Methylocapsa aurea TaxID=663610 RepID=UPI00056CBC9A|nr:ferrochelatase [Methylocapsa aurea]
MSPSGAHSNKHEPVLPGKVGILVVNLGTPDAPRFWSVRRFLKEFLSDRRVVDLPRIIWWPILHFIILWFRPGRVAKNYAAIWNKERNEGPLKATTRTQAEKLAAWIRAGGLETHAPGPQSDEIFIAWAMRYGNPSISLGVAQLKEHGCGRILVLPLYPQYSAATTASVCDEVFVTLESMRWQPAVRIAPPYFNDPAYIDVLATSLRATLSRLDFVPEMILVSFHGIPKSYVAKGDPYLEQCTETWRLLREELGLSADRCPITFQSRFGQTEWLQPYTDATVKKLAREGVKSLVVITPGFSADCLETLFEIGVENRAIFKENGGKNFAVIPCLNDSELGMMVLYDLVEREINGWV